MAILLASIFSFHLYKTRVVLAQQRPYLGLKEVQNRLGSRIGEIKRIQGELVKLSQQQSIFEKVTRTMNYSWLLLRLSNMMNDYTWLTRISIDKDGNAENEVNLQIVGVSFYNEELGSFMDQLSGDSMFNNVELKYAKNTKTTELSQYMGESAWLIKFQIECKVAGKHLK